MKPNSYLIVSDGACSKNPGPGGWGLIVLTPEGQVQEFGGEESETTNNRMELMGVYRGLQEVYRIHKAATSGLNQSNKVLRIISDSKYVLDGAEKSVHTWKRNGWKTSAGTDVKNQDLWEKILKGLDLFKELSFRLEFELVKGHSGHPGNERCDQIAVRFCWNEPIDLFQGKKEDYSISLEKAEPYSLTYLSLVNGKLKRHRTWDECKSETDGKPGARYKKVSNLKQEQEVLAQWGVTTS